MYDDYLLSPYVGILLGSSPAETWKRLVRPPPPPPALWKLDETTPKAPPLVWCEHCQDMTRWCPLYGADTLEESWKVFDEEQRQENEIWRRERKRKQAEEALKRELLEVELEKDRKEREIQAKRRKEEEAKERENERMNEEEESKEFLKKYNSGYFKSWNY